MESDGKPPGKKSGRWQVKTVVALAVVAICNSIGSVLIRAGSQHETVRVALSLPALFFDFHGFLLSGEIWLGIAFRAISGFAFLCLLSWADYSYVSPAAASAYILTVFFGWAALGEVVPLGRWIGALLITFGVALVGLTPPRTTPQGTSTRPVPRGRMPAGSREPVSDA